MCCTGNLWNVPSNFAYNPFSDTCHMALYAFKQEGGKDDHVKQVSCAIRSFIFLKERYRAACAQKNFTDIMAHAGSGNGHLPQQAAYCNDSGGLWNRDNNTPVF